jgi:hypothetical protein
MLSGTQPHRVSCQPAQHMPQPRNNAAAGPHLPIIVWPQSYPCCCAHKPSHNEVTWVLVLHFPGKTAKRSVERMSQMQKRTPTALPGHLLGLAYRALQPLSPHSLPAPAHVSSRCQVAASHLQVYAAMPQPLLPSFSTVAAWCCKECAPTSTLVSSATLQVQAAVSTGVSQGGDSLAAVCTNSRRSRVIASHPMSYGWCRHSESPAHCSLHCS